LGLVEGRPYALHGAQAAGCAPVVRAWKENLDRLPLVKPSTIVRSLAIGDPADGLAAVATIKRTGGRAEEATDPEVLECMRLLAQTEGLFAETAGGTVVAAARKLARAGTFDDGGRVVLLLTGHGLKTVEALSEKPPFSTVIDGRLDEFEEFWAAQGPKGARAHARA
ncbi:MAG TPA: pyridoxal-phosphate dependent enzyme, partial [Vicinamibacteria bacterium]|nr:pyridoxal-phosphate dependent enzyme [Vicinamibacteria bacterium]